MVRRDKRWLAATVIIYLCCDRLNVESHVPAFGVGWSSRNSRRMIPTCRPEACFWDEGSLPRLDIILTLDGVRVGTLTPETRKPWVTPETKKSPGWQGTKPALRSGGRVTRTEPFPEFRCFAGRNDTTGCFHPARQRLVLDSVLKSDGMTFSF